MRPQFVLTRPVSIGGGGGLIRREPSLLQSGRKRRRVITIGQRLSHDAHVGFERRDFAGARRCTRSSRSRSRRAGAADALSRQRRGCVNVHGCMDASMCSCVRVCGHVSGSFAGGGALTGTEVAGRAPTHDIDGAVHQLRMMRAKLHVGVCHGEPLWQPARPQPSACVAKEEESSLPQFHFLFLYRCKRNGKGVHT